MQKKFLKYRKLNKSFCYLYNDMDSDISKYKKHAKVMPLVFLIINALFFIIIFKSANSRNMIYLIGFFAFMILIKEIFMYQFAKKLATKILDPLSLLKSAVYEISDGNYGITINNSLPKNDVGELMEAFNHMSLKLLEAEELKKKYELNRKNLIANISHDLKTPIASILGYVEGIQEGVASSPEKFDKYIKIIRQNAIYTNKLIDDLFLFSTLDIQQLKFDFKKTHIKAFMDDLMTELSLEYVDQDVTFIFEDLLDEDMLLDIDGKRLRQVILNIVSNGIKYNNKDKPYIICFMSYIHDGVQLIISDNGQGIDEDNLQTIFDRFYRVDTSRNKYIGGTGLGLAIAKQIIKAHNGNIWATSKLDYGTNIHFTIRKQLD